MKKVFLLQAVLVATALAFVQASVYADDPPPPPNHGEAHLGFDPRNPDGLASGAFGFAFMTGVVRNSGPQTDTCKTFPDANSTQALSPIDGVASPEESEPILTTLGADAVTFYGRTKDCYYIVSGPWYSSGEGEGGEPPRWVSEFDTGNEVESFPPHFVVTINDRERSDDDFFFVEDTSSLIRIELQDEHNVMGGSATFRLRQHPLYTGGTGSVKFVDASGNEIDPNVPRTVYRDAPNVDVYAQGVEEGDVAIIAEPAN